MFIIEKALSGFSATLVRDTIVVFGGTTKGEKLKFDIELNLNLN